MSVDPQNDFACGDLEYSLLRKILSRLTFIAGGSVTQAYVDSAIAAQSASDFLIYEHVANKSTDGTLAANSATLYPSQSAVKTYVDTGLAGKQNTLGFTPENIANKAVNLLTINDVLYPTVKAVTDALALKQNSLGFTPENIANKAIDFSVINDTLYPTVQAVVDYVAAGPYVLKTGDTMTGDLVIGDIPEFGGPGLKVSLANSVLDLTDPTLAAIQIENPVNDISYLTFTQAGVVQGGILVSNGIFQFYALSQAYYYVNLTALAFYNDWDGTYANTHFYGGYADFGTDQPHQSTGVPLIQNHSGNLWATDGASRNVQLTPDLRIYGVGDETVAYERLSLQWSGTDYQMFMESDASATIRDIVFGIGVPGSAYEHLRLSGDNDSAPAAIGFFAATPVVQQTSGADLTNSVTAGGTDDTIANYTSLAVYATDAAAIRNDIYQLARKLKQINDGLRAYGIFT